MEALLIRPKNEAELNEIKKFINIYHADDKDFQKAAYLYLYVIIF